MRTMTRIGMDDSLPEPVLTRRDDLVDTLHGVPVADPYRWLEDGEAREVRDWTAAQNARTAAALGAVPGRVALEARLRDLLQVGTVTAPMVRGGRCFYLKRAGDQAQSILCARDGADGAEWVLVDPNALAADGLAALDWWEPSPDGRRVAYGVSRDGDEWSTLRVVEVASGETLPDAIPRTRYSSVAWLPDGGGFSYTRYPTPGTVPAGEEEYGSHAFFHRLGTDPAADPKVFGEGRSPQDTIVLVSSADGRWLVATVHQGWARSEVILRDLTWDDGPWVPVIDGVDALFENAIPTADRLYLLTNRDAPNGRIVGIDPTAMAPELTDWTTLVPERADRVIAGFVLAGGRIVAHELEAATSRLRVYGLDGVPLGELALPGLGTVTALDGEADGPLLVAGYTSFATPPAAFVFDTTTGERTPLAPLPPPAGVDPASIEVTQVRYPSKDGTPISMFLVHRWGLTPTGDHPTLLTGYGGFNISEGPEYRAALPAWLERGGVFALPNLRGGGEYGEAWHRAGMGAHKQNVFDDVLAAADWLITAGYTNPDRLAIGGGSNGGLLVGAAITQRPDLFRAALCAVPLLDMVRYHYFRIAKLWIPEYGASDDPAAFAWLHAYSSYHRVVDGVCYPATLLTCGEQDSRVDPLHARKMAALLQHATGFGDDRPILLRAETKAGHGAGKPLAKRIAEAADTWGFLGWQLGVDWVG